MPIDLPLDLLSPDLQEREVEIPVSAHDRAKGTVHVTLREMPYAALKSCQMQGLFSLGPLSKAGETLTQLRDGGGATSEAMLEMGQAFELLRLEQTELIRWGVLSHRAEDFKLKGIPIPCETTEKKLAGQLYRVPNARMILLYQVSSPGLAVGSLWWLLADAVRRFQQGQVRTPEEIWSEAEAEAAKDTAPDAAPEPAPVADAAV